MSSLDSAEKTDSTQIAATSSSGTLLQSDWYALGLLNQFRLFLLIAFAIVFYFAEGIEVLGSRDPELFIYSHLAWSALALGFFASMKWRKPVLEVQFYLQVYCDILCLVALMHASGGVKSGLGVLLLVQIAMIANFTRPRYTLLFAAIATALTFAEELFAALSFGKSAANLPEAAFLGTALFGVALITSALVKRQLPANTTFEIKRFSNAQLKELKEQIVEEIDSGVLHIDERDHVQLINSRGQQLLRIDEAELPAHLNRLSGPLWDSLSCWRAQSSAPVAAIKDSSLSQQLLPHFIKLADDCVLIRLEDCQDISDRLQQLKQASLGRMSSSIAHEIRNPLGAISNAVQLIGESNKLTEQDRTLLQMAHKHTLRINRIIEDVMKLSAPNNVQAEQIQLASFIENIRTRYLEQNDLKPDQFNVHCGEQINCQFDPHHLDQIIWNLCTNGMVHNVSEKPIVDIHIYQSKDEQVTLDICDNGYGIKSDQREMVFEPFFTTESGTGLGLYICRELCELNKASLENIPVSKGACFRIKLNASVTAGSSQDNDWKRAA